MDGRKMQVHEGDRKYRQDEREYGLRAFRGFLERDGLPAHEHTFEPIMSIAKLTCSSPMAETIVTRRSFPSSNPAEI
jgi:hypothetical protein